MARTDFLQGTLDPVTFKALALQLEHGRRISQRVRQVSGELLQVQRGWFARHTIDWSIAVESI